MMQVLIIHWLCLKYQICFNNNTMHHTMNCIILVYIIGHQISVSWLSTRLPVGIFNVQQVSVFSDTVSTQYQYSLVMCRNVSWRLINPSLVWVLRRLGRLRPRKYAACELRRSSRLKKRQECAPLYRSQRNRRKRKVPPPTFKGKKLLEAKSPINHK